MLEIRMLRGVDTDDADRVGRAPGGDLPALDQKLLARTPLEDERGARRRPGGPGIDVPGPDEGGEPLNRALICVGAHGRLWSFRVPARYPGGRPPRSAIVHRSVQHNELDRTFFALSDPTRRSILERLGH